MHDDELQQLVEQALADDLLATPGPWDRDWDCSWWIWNDCNDFFSPIEGRANATWIANARTREPVLANEIGKLLDDKKNLLRLLERACTLVPDRWLSLHEREEFNEILAATRLTK